jgi:hypothetical protein
MLGAPCGTKGPNFGTPAEGAAAGEADDEEGFANSERPGGGPSFGTPADGIPTEGPNLGFEEFNAGGFGDIPIGSAFAPDIEPNFGTPD